MSERKLKSGADAHEFTPEERRRGGLARAAKIRAEREQVDEVLAEALEKATRRLVELIDSNDPAIALRAVVALYDRVLGRPRQALEHSGSLELYSSYDMPAIRAKLERLIENRARRMADENGDGEA
jgi:hypothetical protein